MEVVVWGAVTSFWWMSSVTILLPFLFLLKYNKYFRDRWFSYVYATIIRICIEPKMIPFRKKAFELLKDSLSERDISKPLKILEIGIGPGSNLQFYPENSHLTALDMNVSFDRYFRENQKKYPNIKYEKTVLSVAENMKDIDECSMDVVISTYVLCSVRSVDDVLKEIKRVLKPGGKYLFLEHVRHPKSDWSFTLQKFVEPLWNVYFDGCSLLRNNGDQIRNAGFSHVICERDFPKTIIIFLRPQVYGLAIK